MRKWSCNFDGRGVYEFLEQVRELQRAYQMSDEQLLRGFPELLRGDAQLRYRNCASFITTWKVLEQGLRDFFLSPGERRHLDQQIRERRQGSKKSIRSYTTSLLTLMRRRGGFNHESIMQALYHNMKPGLRILIRPREAITPGELIQRVQEIEEIQAQLPRESPTETKNRRQIQQTSTPPASSIRKRGMLLEVWATGTQPFTLPQRTQTVLLLVRQRGFPDLRVPVTEIGKRQAYRSDKTCSPVRETSSTDPRPFIKVKIGRQWSAALVDPGSVRSYLDQKHAQQCR